MNYELLIMNYKSYIKKLSFIPIFIRHNFVTVKKVNCVMIQVKESKNHYINATALSFGENDLGSPNRVAVSLVGGAAILVHVKGTIDYAADGNFRRWTLKGYSTKLAANTPYYIYARLDRSAPEALITFSANRYALDGSIEGDSSTAPSTRYWYVRIGQLTETDGITNRELTYDSGLLGTTAVTNAANDILSKAFVFHFDDKKDPDKLTSIEALAGLWTEQFLSAKGMNSGGGSSEGGATTLGGLRNVAADADNTFNAAKMLVLEADSNLWTLKNLSELVGLDEDALAEYLTNNNYAKKGDIPTIPTKVSAFDNDANYATTSDLDARIDALVNGAPAAYDTLKEIADVLANNINSIDDILTALGTKVSKDDFNTAIANVNNSISALNTELSGKIDLKLDAVTFNELFEKVQLEDGTWAIKAKLGLFSDGFISAKGSNVGGTSSEGGAVALYQLNDVLADGTGVSGATDGAVFVYDGKLGKWKGIAQSEIVPNLTGYATESWVLQQGFLTQHQDLSDYAKLSDIPVIPTTDINKGVTAYGWGDHSKVGYLTGITSALVTGALGYTPYNAANFTKANIKSTLGISDWALASSKPSYTTKEVAEDTNLYFTNARAVAALKSITDGLQSDIDTKLDASVFSELFEKVTLEDGVTAIRAKYGLFTDYFLSAKGANTNGGSSSGGGLITSLYRYADLGKTFSDTNNDTFNAYTINKINSDLGSRISVLEGKATNVSFTQSLTSGTQIGSISIDGVTKNIYAPTIPTSDINKGVTAYGWGNHASVGYLTSASNLAWGKITGKPTTISGYGITDAITTANIGSQSVANANQLKYTSLTSGEDMNTYYGDTYNGKLLYKSSSIDVANFPFSSGGVLLIKTAGGSYTTQLAFSAAAEMAIRRVINTAQTNWRTILHSENYDDYTYSKSTIDTKLGGYLPLSGGTMTGKIKVGAYTSFGVSGDSFYLGSPSYPLLIRSNGDAKVNGNTIIHSGNIGSQSVDNADKVDGYHVKASNTPFNGIPIVRSDGVMEIGKYIDFHNDNKANNDFDCRLDIQGGNGNVVHLPSTSGILALLTSNVASATKLQTSRSIWGQSFDGTGNVSGDLHLYTSKIYWWGDATNYCISSVARGNSSPYLNIAHYGGISFNTSGYERMYIAGSGNVGIGTTSPAQKLDVNGEILIPNFHALMSRKTDGTQINLIYCGNDDVIKIGGALPIKLQGNTTITGTLNMNAAAMGLGGAIDFQFSDEINRYGGNLYIQHRGDGSQTGTVSGATGNVVMCYNGGKVGIGNSNPQYKLTIDGTLYASGAATFNDIIEVGSVIRMQNAKYIYGRTSDGTTHNILGLNASTNCLINYGANDRGSNAWIYGKDIRLVNVGGAKNGTLGFIDGMMGIGTSEPAYTADIRGTLRATSAVTFDSTLHASGTVSFDSILSVGGTALINGNAAIGGNSDGNRLYVYGVVRSAAYNAIGNNNAAFVFDKPGTNYTGIGANGVADTIYFGACNTSGAWVTDYYQKWHFNGTIYGKVGIWSDGYVSAKGQNTSSDMRLKNVLNDVVLNVNDIANAPSVRFAWKNGGGVDVGSSAQYWQGLLPDAVKERDGMLEMQYANIALLSAIAIAKRSENHEERIKRLEKENMELKQRIVILEGGSYA